MQIRSGLISALVSLVIPLTAAPQNQRFTVLEHESIGYYTTAPTDSIARLQARMRAGEVKTVPGPTHGHLASLLAALDIDLSSQVLITSKTSLQIELISPATPRAVYFNDDTYVAWVQGSPLLEISTVDPKLGAVFYSARNDQPGLKFDRETEICLLCHNPKAPGHVMTSTIPDGAGLPLFHAGSFITSDHSPLEERWGGWYVTGTHGNQLHMGNLVVRDLPPSKPGIATTKVNVDREKGANVTDLTALFDSGKYLSPHSDIVALMVMGHQVYVQNLMTELNYAARQALYAGQGTLPVEKFKEPAEKLLRALFLSGETQLKSPIVGTSGFNKDFEKRGPRDSRGRSLRELDMEHRMFRYPLSYLVYSRAFDALPLPVRSYLYQRIGDVLVGRESDSAFAHLSAADRQAIVEILRDTKPEFVASAGNAGIDSRVPSK